MEINIKNNAGELKIVTRRVDPEYQEIEYSIALDPNFNFELLYTKLEQVPHNVSNARWVIGYIGKIGIIRSGEGNSVYSGLRDLVINVNKLKGHEKEEYRNEYFYLYLKSFINRFIYLNEIIRELN